jgi:uncharacterized repeat protein (TIGR01451 family)
MVTVSWPAPPPGPPGPDLALTKTASVETVHPGGQVTYQLVVHNHGPGNASGVIVEDAAPSGLSFGHIESSQGRCTITTELRCTLGTVHAGGEVLIQLTATVAAGASGPIVNLATVRGNRGELNESNNTATSTVHVVPPASAQPVSDLRVQLHGPRGLVRAGQHHTFTIVVTNHGPDAAGGVVVTFTASLPLRIISAHAHASAVHDSCTGTLPVRCELGTLPTGGRVTLRIVAMPRVAGVLRTAAAVMSESGDPDPRSSVATAKTTTLAARTPRAPPRPPVTG